MKIVLSGVETNNKGAELMLYSILQEIEKKHPGSEVFLPIPKQTIHREYPSIRINFKQDSRLQIFARNLRILSLLRKFHLPCGRLEDSYPIKNADYYFDASGYLLTDAWPMSDYSVEYFKEKFKKYKAQGTKIVFLPQAIGPLNKKVTQMVLKTINQYADIIMPRDQISMDYINETGIDTNRFCIYGDFTSLIHCNIPPKYSHLKGMVAMIFNSRMLDQAGLSKEVYFNFMANAIKTIRRNGHDVYLLNHEGKQDEELLFEFNKLNHDCEIVTGLNGLEIKGLISSAYLCVSSRFHGAASSLNSCVPCLATSWSHKYKELFNEYKQENCLLNVTDIDSSMLRIEELLGDDNALVRANLKRVVPSIQKKTEYMWNFIWNLI